MKFRRGGRDSHEPHINLEDEHPTAAADLHVKREHLGWVSSLGNVALFVGAARRFADRMRISVDDLVGFLRTKGVTEEFMSTLAVVVHPPEDNDYKRRMKVTVGGWFDGKEVWLGGPEREAVTFSRALHVVPKRMNERALNHTLLHEAGHLVNAANNAAGKILYDPGKVKLTRALGIAGMSLSAAGMVAGLGYTEAHPLPVASAGAFAATVSAVPAIWPLYLLWQLSSEERSAERFATENREHHFVSLHGGPADNHFTVDRDLITYSARIVIA